ncbi:MAG: N-6 DNA methylase [Treponema sp.]|jgi:adenine-specific DNA-methyltransferase|nr:N-6 DNA methylase [Treponema sp.]
MLQDPRIDQLHALASLFSANITQYKSTQYDEANTRTDFIDKLFTLLDWDIANNQGFSETYRDVVREDKVKIDGSQKAPDYSFRIGGVRKFFVEAKKPAVNIKDTAEPAYQVRRYAYTAKLPLSILTNFAEFAVYDTRIKPNKDDKASAARIFYCTFDQYEQHFDFISSTFSKDAILKGSFDKYVEANKNKKGTSEVDTELLALVEEWRMELAKNIAKNNPALSIYSLNTVVQRIIDRIVFLRIAEDKGIEDENLLLTVAKTSDIYEKLMLLFTKANVKYNSGLFAYVNWIDKVRIDDKILSNIIVNLYYPECPYEFSVLPIEILGSIYERFLGKTIRFRSVKGDTRTAIIEEKPEVKKAGGVFYTPQYIVDYIVQNTVGEKMKNKTPDEIAEIKICDPACGSGSFLVGAYQYLLNYHLDYYTQPKNVKSALKNGKIYEACLPSLREASFQSCKLTIEEKQRILTTTIYGVDIDSQAVEVTKLSLYLKLLENEGKEAEGQLFKYSDKTLLPSLEDNIKCGNSLIGTDFYAQGDLALTDDDRIKVNCFDWEKEFPAIFKNGGGTDAAGEKAGEFASDRRSAQTPNIKTNKDVGFDVVIGNPPYVFTRELMIDIQKKYYYENYKNTQFKLNTYILFSEKAYNILTSKGYFGFIIPNNWLTLEYSSEFRKFILENTGNIKIVTSEDKVFFNANVDVSILTYSKTRTDDVRFFVLRDGLVSQTGNDNIKNILQNHNYILNYKNDLYSFLQSKIEKISIHLQKISEVKNGVQAYTVGEGTPKQTKNMKDNRVYHGKKKVDKTWIKYIDGVDVKRYLLGWSGQYIKYGDNLSRPRKYELFTGERILVRQIPSKPPYSILATFIKDTIINDNNSMIIKMFEDSLFSLKFILGIINSKLISYWFIHKFGKLQRNIFPQFKINELKEFIIPDIDLTKKADKTKHDHLVSLVDKILELKQKEATELNQQLKTMISRQIEGVDRAIDKFVYELYDLDEEEVKIVEGD